MRGKILARAIKQSKRVDFFNGLIAFRNSAYEFVFSLVTSLGEADTKNFRDTNVYMILLAKCCLINSLLAF
mgnify:CR=1 FL=1